MQYTYKTRGTCSSRINIETDGDVIRAVEFEGGCDGNLNGISKLVEGLTVKEVIGRLSGIRCGAKSTSCPDQLTKALTQMLESPADQQ